MSDINWRFISEDHSLFLGENKNRKIVVETLYGVIRVVKKYAYIE
jgi:hypothetical protein